MIYMFLAHGFEEVEAIAPLDLLRRANLEVTTVGVGGKTVTGAHGITVQADIDDSMYADKNPEMIILPGGMPGTRNLDSSPVLNRALKDAADCGAYLTAICAAPMILGRRGLLAGKKAICFPGFEKYMDGARLSGHPVVRDGKVVTAVGMGAALKFGLELVAALKGEDEAANLKASAMCD